MEKAYEPVTRTRAEGRKVTRSLEPADKLAALREIVKTCSYAIVDGATVDLFSASAIVKVYDALNEANRKMFLSFPISKMAKVAFKLLK